MTLLKDLGGKPFDAFVGSQGKFSTWRG